MLHCPRHFYRARQCRIHTLCYPSCNKNPNYSNYLEENFYLRQKLVLIHITVRLSIGRKYGRMITGLILKCWFQASMRSIPRFRPILSRNLQSQTEKTTLSIPCLKLQPNTCFRNSCFHTSWAKWTLAKRSSSFPKCIPVIETFLMLADIFKNCLYMHENVTLLEFVPFKMRKANQIWHFTKFLLLT